MLTQFSVFLKKRKKVLRPITSRTRRCSPEIVATGNRNLQQLGYTIDREVFAGLLCLHLDQVDRFFELLTGEVKKWLGAHVAYRPMYPNFPRQVMEACDCELYFNAMAHYWGAAISDLLRNPTLVILPQYDKEDRPPLPESEKKPLKVIGLGTPDEFYGIFTELCSANSSLSPEDKEILAWFCQDMVSLDYVPAAIPQKETLALLISSYLAQPYDTSELRSRLKTATDVLRVASSMSEGDISLAKPTKFRSFRRKERRFLLTALDGCGNITEDMLRHKEKWKRLGERLHPGEYTKLLNANLAFKTIREDLPFAGFASKVETAIRKSSVREVCDLLAQRPGMFARRLDHLMRKSSGTLVPDRFLRVAKDVSTPVLLQCYAHFKARRLHDYRIRSFAPKGDVAKLYVKDELPASVDPEGCERLHFGIHDILEERFAKLPPLGNVYIDDSLQYQFVPFGMRSASKALRTLVRGSRLPLADDVNTLRFFLWWREGRERVDIDLSAQFLDESFQPKVHIYYRNLRTTEGCHSGDITSAPNGACEFIDIPLSDCKYSYIAMCINSFTQQPYKDLPECFAGWMARSAPNSGEVFEPQTVQDKIDLASATKTVMPALFDVRKRQMIWTDLSLSNRVGFANNVVNNKLTIAKVVQGMTQLTRPTCYDLFSIHGLARGKIVDTKEQADIIFSMHEGITPFDTNKILAEFLAN